MTSKTAVVVGAGPVGCLAARALSNHGWKVVVYERRPDIRLPSSKAAAKLRSINLAISYRGLAAIEAIDPLIIRRFMKTVIPMRGRMMHTIGGKLESHMYDKDGQCINSIDRALLNEVLLEAISESPNISLFFNHKVLTANFNKNALVVRDLDSNVDFSVNFDFCVGSDGSYSAIRQQMMKVVRMEFEQRYIPHEYIELKIPAGKESNGESIFLLEPDYLHIWPRHSFMLVALPNNDKSFTCTLFAPSAEFDLLDSADNVLDWLKANFPDVLNLVGEKKLVQDLLKSPRSPLICTKSSPYHYKDRAIILGDAAHSMAPFFGQGLNCGLEDVRILLALMHEEGVDSKMSMEDRSSADEVDWRMAQALQRYSDSRHEDLSAICDMAMDNYVEMRHSVTTLGYLLKKKLDNLLYSFSGSRFSLAASSSLLSRMPYPSECPSGWIPLYTMVTFRPDISYATARRRAEKQSRIVAGTGWIGLSILGCFGIWMWRKSY